MAGRSSCTFMLCVQAACNNIWLVTLSWVVVAFCSTVHAESGQ